MRKVKQQYSAFLFIFMRALLNGLFFHADKLIQELQDEVNRLILRVKQLTTLLKQANITIPSGPTIKSLGKRKLKWTDKLSPDDVENKKQRLNNDSPVQSKEITKGEHRILLRFAIIELSCKCNIHSVAFRF